MLSRIKRLCKQTVSGAAFVTPTEIEYDRCDLFLPPLAMQAKRVREYVLAQTPQISDDTALTGYLSFRGNVHGDIFHRGGHEHFKIAYANFYCKPVENLATFEWQHSVADFEKVIRIGISGYRSEIAESRKKHADDPEGIEFLDALSIVADAIVEWAHKCADAALERAGESTDAEAKARLTRLSETLRRVPEHPAENFYEAIETVYIIYPFVPDSIGTIDRYLYPFYLADKASGRLTDEEATAYLQELFLMLQARISIKSDRFYRGGESHFCIGGYLENGEDGFTELSRLVLDALIELPTWIPQISLRWTKKTPREVLRYCMDCERRDPHKRIAFVSDEPRIKAMTEIGGFPYKLACRYTMVGCNEPQLPGGIYMAGCTGNLVQALEHTLYDRRTELSELRSFEEFYAIFKEELYATLRRILYYYNGFQRIRARDVNVTSSMFFEGSIERARSITEGGAKNAIASLGLLGITTVIDSLTVICEQVFEKKRFSLSALLDAIGANWQGHEQMRAEILAHTAFFGNDGEISNEIGARLGNDIKAYFADKRTELGYPYLTGNLIGYNQHHAWFGEKTPATPDGRYAGEAISFGIGQTDGRDREGLTAYLASVAKLNNNLIFCGATVTNVLLEASLVKNDANFEKLVLLFETYFRMGGLHFQTTYVTKEEMIAAKRDPEKYRSLRVRVSGFSDFFRNLNEDLQDDLIRRTEKKG